MSDTPDTTTRMATRSRNATAHPGLVDASSKRTYGEKTRKEVAEERKQKMLQKKQDAIRTIGDIEKRMAANDMVDVTPGPRTNRRQYQHTQSFSYIPLTKGAETDHAKHAAAIDTDVSENELPKKKAKPGKVSLRDSVKLYIEQENPDNDGRKRKNIGNKGQQDGSVDIESDLDNEESVSKGHTGRAKC